MLSRAAGVATARRSVPTVHNASPVDAFEEFAADYAAAGEDNAWNALYERPAMISLLGDVAGRRVLDAGCGAGPLALWLSACGAEVVGFDRSAAMVELARRRGIARATFHVADLGEPLEFLDSGSFDLLAAGLVLHYLRDWVAPLRELRRVMRDGGRLVLSTHHPAADVRLSDSGEYLSTELIHDEWRKGGRAFRIDFWRRPLHEMFAAFDLAGWRVERLVEPLPVPECRERFPQAWARLTKDPAFLLFRLAPLA